MQILPFKNSRRLEVICLVLLFLTLLFIAISEVSAQISEIMPNPDDSCSDCSEWIEFRGNMSGFILDTGDSSNFTINFTVDETKYLIVTKNISRFMQLWPGTQAVIIEWNKMSLRNSGDSVMLYDSSLALKDNVTYPDFSSKANLTFCLCSSWQVCTPSTGNENNCQSNQSSQENQSQQSNSSQTNQTNFNLKLKVYIENATSGNIYTSLFKIETNKDNCSIKDNITITYNISNSQYFYQNSSVKEIGCSGYANTGYWLAVEGNFTICGTASSREETNYSDNSACRIIQVQAGESILNQSAENETEENTENDNSSSKNYEYIITEVPEIINESNLNFTINIIIKNNRNESKTFDVWSYIYRANKCYSGEREANKKTLSVNAKDENSTELYNYLNVSEIKENGDYKFKVKILRTEIKTPKEFTYNITINLSDINPTIKSKSSNKTITEKAEGKEEFLNNQSIKVSEAYLSKGEEIKNLSPYLFAVVCLMTIMHLIKNREVNQ